MCTLDVVVDDVNIVVNNNWWKKPPFSTIFSCFQLECFSS
jgi:hypothetical protein